MRYKLLHPHRSPRLALIFAGWGMDPHPFEGVGREGYDIALVWDYRDLSATWAGELADYTEIAVIAWSFGVPAAARFIVSHPSLPFTARIAVNGTMHPVDDRLGIPEEIFGGTLASLDERNLMKFHRRMCGGGAGYRLFSEHLPQRDVEELRGELSAIGRRGSAGDVIWDTAIISSGDLIIPPRNQMRAWETDACGIITTDGPHLPDFNVLLNRHLTDKRLVETKFRNAAATYESNAMVQRDITDRLLAAVPDGGHALEIGAGTGYATAELARRTSTLEVWDLTLSPAVEELASTGKISARACDAETAIASVASGSIDLLFSASTVQWFNSLPAFLREVWRVLAPGGTALISTFGPQTMTEIHATAGTSPGFPSAGTIRRMIPMAEVTEELMTLTFASPAEALRHVRLTGVNSLGTAPSPAVTRRIITSYPLSPDGSAPLTYQPIYITIRKTS